MMESDITIFEEICDFLDTCRGRDQIIRALSCITKLGGGLTNDKVLSKRLLIFSSKMSATRVVLRLFEDLPTLRSTIEYGWGKEEPDLLLAYFGVLSNIIDHIFLPIDKISWLAENKIISVDGEPWGVAGSIIWVTSTVISFLKSIRHISLRQEIEASEHTEQNELVQLRSIERLTLFRTIIDLIQSISSLPEGILWSSKLNTWQLGLLGTISSLTSLYLIYWKRCLKKE